MARNIFSKITAKAIDNLFADAMGQAPRVYENHCMIGNSDSSSETYAWLGMLPVPRKFLSGRDFQGIRDFNVTLANEEYEMSFIIDQTSMEDDSTGQISARLTDVFEVWSTFEDSLFATLLEAGAASTATFDGVTFFDDTRTIGSSGAIDNDRTSNITTTTSPTVAELAIALNDNISAMWVYEDDHGRPSFNAQAMSSLRAIIHPQYVKAFTELVNSNMISSSDNPWGKNLVDIDVLPYLTGSDVTYYLSAVGASRKPYVCQKRVEPQVVSLTSADDIADNHGLKVLSRARIAFGYGDPRRGLQHVFT